MDTAWHALAETLRLSDVDVLFGLPDDDMLLPAALEAHAIRVILCRDQRNAVFMAAGHAMATGRPAYCVVGRGPAVANAVAGLVEASTGRVPLVLIASGTDADRVGTGAFQELDQLALVRPLVKWSARVERPELLAATLAKAALIAASGAPGPVYLEVPGNVGAAPTPAPLASPLGATGVPSAVDRPAVLDTARRPIVVVGGGMRHRNAERVVERFAASLGAAIVVTASGRGAVDESHPLFCGVTGLYAPPPVRELWRQADLVVALGSRLEETAVQGWDTLAEGVPVLQVNIEPVDLSCRWSGPRIVGEAASVLAGWSMPEATANVDWVRRVGEARAAAVAQAAAWAKQPRADGQVSVVDVLETLDGTVPRDRILVQENGLADMWSYFWPYWTCHTAGGSVVPSEQTSLGFGAAAALGVKLGAPDRPVVAFVGDGAFNLFRSDLATAVEAGVGLLYVVLDNGGYGWLQHQLDTVVGTPSRFHFAGRPREGGGMSGVWHERVTDRGHLADGLARAWSRCAEGRVAVLEIAVRLDDIPPCLWPAGHESGETAP